MLTNNFNNSIFMDLTYITSFEPPLSLSLKKFFVCLVWKLVVTGTDVLASQYDFTPRIWFVGYPVVALFPTD